MATSDRKINTSAYVNICTKLDKIAADIATEECTDQRLGAKIFTQKSLYK